MTRLVPVTVLVMLMAVSGVAGAQTMGGGTLPNNATLAFYQLKINEGGNGFQLPSSPVEQRKYFNLPHCQCSQKNAGKETQFEYLLTLSQVTSTHRGAEIWTGTSCSDPANRAGNAVMCRSLTASGINGDSGVSIQDIDSLVPSGFTLKLSTYDVFAGANPDKGCTPEETAKQIWILMDTDASGDLDYSLPQNAGQIPGDTTTPGAGMDTYPPPAPLNLSAEPGENAIQLSWSAPTARATDINAYQALCAKADGTAAKSSPPAALYQTTETLCQIPNDLTLLTASGTTTAPGVDANTTNPLPASLQSLDSAFICGEADASTATSMTVGGLENGTAYYVLLLSIDLHGNYSGTYLTDTITPVPVTDFWEDLHGRGSKTEGGLCLLAETYGDNSPLTTALRAFRDDTLGGSRAGRWLTELYYATLGTLGVHVHGSIALRAIAAVLLAPLVALALLWYWLTLPGVFLLLAGLVGLRQLWRRRRAWVPRLVRVTVPSAATAAIALSAGPAHAGGYEPYWETDPTTNQDANESLADTPDSVHWHAGIRVGPYIPDIDKQLGATPGPYEQMFGGAQVLPMLDVDRILWSRFGQLGVGASIGYMQKSARPFAMGSDPMSPDRPRAPGAKNSFHLIPFALSATYRFTWFDDEYGIPVVPYLKGGVAYYAWWINAPSGDLAEVCKGTGVEPDCSQDKALGASLGVQGSIGLAIRAERLDPSTAMSMRQSGIQHAGLYGELSLAKVDGFGSDKKLSVGGRTWFAGVDFEF